MNQQEAQRERQRHRSQDIPDHQRDGKTLPQQIEGDHAYRDEPPEHDPSLWATHGLTCLVCETEFPAAPAGERRERLNDGQVDVGDCPECERKTPAMDASQAELPSPSSGYDDTIWLVSTSSSREDRYRPISAERSEDSAREIAEQKRSDPFVTAMVDCIGLNY